MIKQDEVLDVLSEGLFLLQKKRGFKYGVDSILLTSFFKCRFNDRVLEFGSGTGVISLLINKIYNAKVTGIEIQKDYVDMSNRTLKINAIKNVEFIHGDFCNLNNHYQAGSIDVIVSNPPYFKTDIVSNNQSKSLARHEIAMDLERLVISASRLLKNRGNLFLLYPTDRLQELLYVFQKYNLSLRNMRFVHSKINEKSHISLITAVKNTNSQVIIHPPLILYDTSGYTQDLLDIYRKLEMEK